jgi:hypothetical protein
MHTLFTTTSIDLAAYLQAIGYAVLDTPRQGKFLAFTFDPSAAS